MQKVISTFDSYTEFYNEHKDYYNIIMEFKAAYRSESDISKDEIAQKLVELIEIPAETIKMSIKEGYYREVDPVMLSLFLAALTEGMLQYKEIGLFDAVGVSDSDFRKFMADIVGEGVQKKGQV